MTGADCGSAQGSFISSRLVSLALAFSADSFSWVLRSFSSARDCYGEEGVFGPIEYVYTIHRV